jgi:hypothetical protein
MLTDAPFLLLVSIRSQLDCRLLRPLVEWRVAFLECRQDVGGCRSQDDSRPE